MKDQDPRQVGRKNILALQHLGESDKDFADRIGISPATLSNMKNDGQGAGVKTLMDVARATGYTVDSLLGLSGGTTAPNAVETTLEDMAAMLERARKIARGGSDE